MKAILGGLLAAGLMLGAATEARAYQYPVGPGLYPSGFYGPYPGYYTAFPAYRTAYGAPGFHSPVYPVPAYHGSPSYPYPAYYGGFGYTYSYFTHVPGYSFTYYRGRLPRYYPGPYGGLGAGYYGYGPYGW